MVIQITTTNNEINLGENYETNLVKIRTIARREDGRGEAALGGRRFLDRMKHGRRWRPSPASRRGCEGATHGKRGEGGNGRCGTDRARRRPAR